MQALNGRDKFVAAAARMFPLLERFETRGTFVSSDRAMFAYDFVCREPIGVSATAELVRFEDGLSVVCVAVDCAALGIAALSAPSAVSHGKAGLMSSGGKLSPMCSENGVPYPAEKEPNNVFACDEPGPSGHSQPIISRV